MYVNNQFDAFKESTIGAAYLTKSTLIQQQLSNSSAKKEIRFEIWDTAGQERYKSLTPMYYRNAKLALIVYDITIKKTFENACGWIDELTTNSDILKTNIIVVGNKLDLDTKREVDKEYASDTIEKKGAMFMEVSAKLNLNVEECFIKLGQSIKDEAVYENNEQGIKLNGNQISEQKECSC